MPHVIVKLYPGRSQEQKQRLAEAIANVLAELAPCQEKSVSISMEEVSPEQWAERVFRPDILEKPRQLVKAPGYNPFDVKS